MEQKIDELLSRGVANIIPGKDELKKALLSERKLNVYFGIDCTSTKIHLGHAVPLRKFQALAELGHSITFLIGDFTSLIGDTSDKDTERPVLTVEQIEQNFQTYKRQAEKIVDFSRPNVKVRRNSEWLKTLTFADIVKLCQHFSVGDFVSRELIRKRLTDRKRVGLHEFLYPVMQGYDSYFMNTDIQLGGTDQTFNMQAGRTLQKILRNKESFVMTTPLLEGSDGRKMSKSWGNAIWLDDSPEDMFAKAMAINDELIVQYYTLATNVSMDEVQKVEELLEKGAHPLIIKKHLAYQIVQELYSPGEAKQAQELFERRVQKKEMVGEIEELEVAPTQLLNEEFLVANHLVESKSDAKRLFEQGGIQINDEKIIDNKSDQPLVSGTILKIGKRKLIKLITSNET